MDDKRLIKSYVWHGDDCFFVSTIERDSSAAIKPPVPRFAETLVWEYDWDAVKRGHLVHQRGSNAVITYQRRNPMTTNMCYECQCKLSVPVPVYCRDCWDTCIKPLLQSPVDYKQALEDWREMRAIEKSLKVAEEESNDRT